MGHLEPCEKTKEQNEIALPFAEIENTYKIRCTARIHTDLNDTLYTYLNGCLWKGIKGNNF